MESRSGAFIPHHLVVGAPVAEASRVTMVLHGILGSSRHWRSFARSLTSTGDQCFVLVDMRGHGASHGAPGENTLQSCASDLVRLQEHLGRPSERVVGHSFGGKVALTLGLRTGAGVEEVWSLDSPPGGRGDRDEEDPGKGQIGEVLKRVSQIALPASDRGSVVRQLEVLGLPEPVAGWMGTNLVHEPETGGLVWAFDLPVVEDLLADYFAQNLWDHLRRNRSACRVHLVRAEQSDRWSGAELRRLGQAGLDGQAKVHVLEDAGHWLHVDNPAGLATLLE